NNTLTIVELNTGRSYLAQAFAPQIAALSTPAFSPDGAQIAAAYLIMDPAPTQGQPRSGIAIWDAATGAFIRAKAYAELIGQPSADPVYDWALLGDWTAAGIQWHENCYACEGVLIGEWSLWDPTTDSIALATGKYFDLFFSDELSITGERVLATTYPGLPIASLPGLFAPQNVIQYNSTGQIALPYEPDLSMPIVFFDVAMRNLSRPLWIADGLSILAHDGSTHRYAVVQRDGFTQHFTYEGSMMPLFGTPSGWVALASPDDRNFRLVEYVPAFGGVEAVDLGFQWAQPVNIAVLRGPDLGVSLLDIPPAPAPIAFPSPAEIEARLIEAGLSCPGSPVSRLYPDSLALVTAGSPNNLRAAPDQNSQILSQIPAGDILNVLSGPICDPANGLVWWEVDYLGTRGYTVESVSGQYALEPMSF
ncbi:MAG: SH3 domain-containing protein, partial [Anaerolinea sp.]|nr:SH3 domain-containing protein [Anaerolinea sp.]